MIEINNLSFGFSQEMILNNLNLTINNGDYLAIIGPNGIGKSTLIKCLVGAYKVKHNMLKINGNCINCFNEWSKIGYVPQIKNQTTELPITAYELFKLIQKDQQKIKKLSKQFKLQNFLHKNINDLSGGQLQRINICKALLHDIDYLILDEPNSGLDDKSRVDLATTLKELNTNGLTIIVVSHHLKEIEKDVNKSLNLENNQLKQQVSHV
ncbi:MAG: metal ABC transporter ATP-binding protein [Erysipelotrichaceae bacterium]